MDTVTATVAIHSYAKSQQPNDRVMTVDEHHKNHNTPPSVNRARDLLETLSPRLSATEVLEFQGQVLLYSISGCPFCSKAKALFNKLRIPYIDINLDLFPAERANLRLMLGAFTVPQIFFNQIHIGGFSALEQIIRFDQTRWLALLAKLQLTTPGPDAPLPPDPNTASEAFDPEDIVDCEMDEFVLLALELRRSGILAERKDGWFFRRRRHTFYAKNFVDWICAKLPDLTATNALDLLRELVRRKFVKIASRNSYNTDLLLSPLPAADKKTDIDSEKNKKDELLPLSAAQQSLLFVLVDVVEVDALNVDSQCLSMTRPANIIAEDLRKMIVIVQERFVSADGTQVDYERMAKAPQFNLFIRLSQQLQRADITSLSRAERVALYINIYNTLLMHGHIVLGEPANMWERLKFLDLPKYFIGGYAYSLNEIEHGLLRNNRRPPGSFFTLFGTNNADPRLEARIEEIDPRIHCALNWGALGCPPIRSYSAAQIDELLELATQSFLMSDDGLRLEEDLSEIHASTIFKWYWMDFVQAEQQLIDWFFNHLPVGEKLEAFRRMRETGRHLRLKFIPFNWASNNKNES